MCMKCYRCGYCGNPCDIDGRVLEMWQIAVLNPFVDWNNADLVYGECCAYEQEEDRRQVTREMAMDAGSPEMEGMYIRW